MGFNVSRAVPVSQCPLLIAVAGLGPRTGVTTTTLALAHQWPGPDPAVLVEADPEGGQLAELAGTDPYRGLASVARAAHAGAGPVRLAQHLQFLAGGVGVLAAPPGPDPRRQEWVTTLLTGRNHDRRLDGLAVWRELGATVFVDCGVPGSAEAPIVAAADACLIVLDAELADPASAGRQIRELAGHSPHPGVLLIGAEPGSDYATALQLPVLAGLPHDRHAATAVVLWSRFQRRRNSLLRAARTVAITVETQLRPPAPVLASTDTDGTPVPRRARWPARLPGRRTPVGPRVYRLELPVSAASVPEPIHAPMARRAQTRSGRPSGHTTDDAEHADDTSGGQDTVDAAPPAHRTPQDSPLPSPPAPAPAAAARSRLVVLVFGPTRLWVGDGPVTSPGGVEITRRLQPQGIELLAVLALHPDGMSRAELLEALWGAHMPAKPNNAFNSALHRLRAVIASATGTERHAVVQFTQGRARYRLDPAHVRVDYWDFTDAVTARRRAATDEDRALACARILDIDAGIAPLVPDLSHPWVEPMRDAAHRDALNALGWLAAHTMTTDPRTTLGMLETATETDPYNEALWQNILRLHAKLGEYDALARTYTLLRRKLTEIDTTPSRETQQLFHHLQRTTR